MEVGIAVVLSVGEDHVHEHVFATIPHLHTMATTVMEKPYRRSSATRRDAGTMISDWWMFGERRETVKVSSTWDRYESCIILS